jgi:hypothetical protein
MPVPRYTSLLTVIDHAGPVSDHANPVIDHYATLTSCAKA